MNPPQILRVISILMDREVNVSINKNIYEIDIFGKGLIVNIETTDGLAPQSGRFMPLNSLAHIFNWVLIQVIKNEGWERFSSRICSFICLTQQERTHIQNIVSYKLRGLTPEEVYNNITYSIGTHIEAGEILNISPKFIQTIRTKNRRVIVSSIVNEVLHNEYTI